MPMLDVAHSPVARLVTAGVEGPTSAAVGLPIILALVAVIVIGFALYAVIRKR